MTAFPAVFISVIVVCWGGNLMVAAARIADLSPSIRATDDDPVVAKLTSDAVRQQFIRLTDVEPSSFRVLAYSRQDMKDGVNFFAKVRTSEGNNAEYVHLRLYESSTSRQPPQIVAFMLNMQMNDPIVYFLKNDYEGTANNFPRGENLYQNLVTASTPMAQRLTTKVAARFSTPVMTRQPPPPVVFSTVIPSTTRRQASSTTRVLPNPTTRRQVTDSSKAPPPTMLPTTPDSSVSNLLLGLSARDADQRNKAPSVMPSVTPQPMVAITTKPRTTFRPLPVIQLPSVSDGDLLQPFPLLPAQVASQIPIQQAPVPAQNQNSAQAQPRVTTKAPARNSTRRTPTSRKPTQTQQPLIAPDQIPAQFPPFSPPQQPQQPQQQTLFQRQQLQDTLSDTEAANDDVRAILSKIKSDYIIKTGTNPTFFQLVSYRTQPWFNGAITYFMKVYVSYNTWSHLRVLTPPSSPDAVPVLVAIDDKKGLFDAIDYFGEDNRQQAPAAMPTFNRAASGFSNNNQQPISASDYNNNLAPADSPTGVQQRSGSNSNSEPPILSSIQPADTAVASLADAVRAEYFRRSGVSTNVYQPVSYRATATEDGAIYFVKVRLGLNVYSHLRLAVPFADSGRVAQLEGFQSDKIMSDPIEYFEPAIGGPAPVPVVHPLNKPPQSSKPATQKPTSPKPSARPSPQQPLPQPSQPGEPEEPLLPLLPVSQPLQPLSQPQNFVRPADANALDNTVDYVNEVTASMKAGKDVKLLVSAIKPQFVKKAAFDPANFDAVSYRLKLVAGEIFFVKVQLGQDEFAHLRIFKPIPYTTDRSVLEAWQLHKTATDPISYFEESTNAQRAPKSMSSNQVTDEDQNFFVIVTPGAHPRAAPYPPKLVPGGRAGQEVANAASQAIDHMAEVSSNSDYIATGLSGVMGARSSTIDLVAAVKPDFLRTSVFNPPMFTAINERLQQTNLGIIHFVKVQMNTNSFVHLKILVKDHSSPPTLLSFDFGKTLTERIEFF